MKKDLISMIDRISKHKDSAKYKGYTTFNYQDCCEFYEILKNVLSLLKTLESYNDNN